jgi:dihydroxyacid dehydratase/phosphogluconate dehydratase
MHLLKLSEAVKEGVENAGMVGFRFNTIGVSDAISMGTRGMCFSLQSRDLIADSIETVMSAQWYDGNISIPGCDKNMPGTIMAMGRLNRPGIMVYGGTIKPGHFQDKTYDIVSAFQVSFLLSATSLVITILMCIYETSLSFPILGLSYRNLGDFGVKLYQYLWDSSCFPILYFRVMENLLVAP